MQRPLSYFWIIALILLIYPHPAPAQKKVRRMTLEEATFLAKERSIQALIAKQEFKVSYLTYKTFRRGYLPQLSASGTLPDFERNIAAYLNPDQSYSYLLSQSINYIGNVSLKQKIGFTGGDISLNSGLQRIDNLNPSSTISNNSTAISYYSTL